MRKCLCLAFFTALVFITIPADAQSLNGTWRVQTNEAVCTNAGAKGSTFAVIFTAIVAGTDLTGTISGARGSADGKTKIGADGTFKMNIGTSEISGKFAGDKLSITVRSSICQERNGTGGRIS